MSVSVSGKIILQNEYFKVAIHPFGAELQSLFSKKLNAELIWQAGSEWPKYSPVLFPIVGGLRNDVINHNSFQINLKRHGFAREMNFNLKEATDTKAVFFIEDSPDTLKWYPFRFRFSIEYLLKAEFMQINMSVQNTGNDALYCSYGAHPAFRIPLFEGEVFEDYQLEFNPQSEVIRRFPLKDNLIADDSVELNTPGGKLSLTHGLFAQDAIVLKQGFDFVSLVNDSKGHGIKMQCENWPYFGIWSAKNADFICIEPWQGIADTESSVGELEKKEGILMLKPGEVHTSGYRLTVI